MSELKKVLLIWMAVCIILAGCANKLSATESGVKPEVPPLSTFPETSAAIEENTANTLPLYEFQVKVSEERVLSVILHLEEQIMHWMDCFSVRAVRLVSRMSET